MSSAWGRRLPNVRIAGVMEAVVVLAVGISCARSQVHERYPRLAQGVASEWLRVVLGAWYTGVALSSGVFLAFEAARRRSPTTWGIGRWIWCISALKAVLSLGYDLVLFVVAGWWKYGKLADESLFTRMVGLLGITLGRDFTISLVAFAATAALSQKLVDPNPDAREYTGRLFGSMIVSTTIAAQLLYVLGS